MTSIQHNSFDLKFYSRLLQGIFDIVVMIGKIPDQSPKNVIYLKNYLLYKTVQHQKVIPLCLMLHRHYSQVLY